MPCAEHMALDRRQLLRGAAASLALWGLTPRAALAGTRDPRFLTIILRGGLDGLALVAPVGDPGYESVRGASLIARGAAAAGEASNGLPLDSFFSLNRAMPFLHELYGKHEALFVHAVATPYRERSHFDGQDLLESGLERSLHGEDGWLNRALTKLPAAEQANHKGLAMGAVVPLVMRGPAPVLSWIPKTYNLPLRDSTIARLTDLYGRTDPALAAALARGLEIEQIEHGGGQRPNTQNARAFRELISVAETAAEFLSTPGGPRIGALSYDGWDTHANEGIIEGQLANRLAGLDAALRAFAERMGPAWKDTVAILVTEFGRTVKINGSEGTDHGTATVAVIIGGTVAGGRVLADWPGLSSTALYQGRDLMPTTDLRAILKGVLQDHLGIPKGALASTVFPESGRVAPAGGLIA